MFYKSMIWKIPNNKPVLIKYWLSVNLVMKTGFEIRYDWDSRVKTNQGSY